MPITYVNRSNSRLLAGATDKCSTPAGRSCEVRQSDNVALFCIYYIFRTPAAFEPFAYVRKSDSGYPIEKEWTAVPSPEQDQGQREFSSLDEAIDYLAMERRKVTTLKVYLFQDQVEEKERMVQDLSFDNMTLLDVIQDYFSALVEGPAWVAVAGSDTDDEQFFRSWVEQCELNDLEVADDAMGPG